MKNVFTVRRYTFTVTFVFVLAVLCSAATGKLFSADKVYFPIDSVSSSLTVTDILAYSSEHFTVSAVHLLSALVAAFSVFAFPVAVGISLLRGITLGYTVALISDGAVMNSEGAIMTVRDSVPIFVFYTASTVLILLFTVCCAAYSVELRDSFSFRRGVRLVGRCLVFSGAVLIIDTVKAFFV